MSMNNHPHELQTQRVKRHTPWSEFFGHPASLVLILSSWTAGWTAFLLLSEMPTFLTDELDFDLTQAGFLCMLPYVTLFVMTVGFGALFDAMVSRNVLVVRSVRQYAQFIAFGGSSLFLLLSAFISSPFISYGCLVLAQGLLGASQSGLGCALLDISPRYTSRYFSVLNTVSALAGIGNVLI